MRFSIYFSSARTSHSDFIVPVTWHSPAVRFVPCTSAHYYHLPNPLPTRYPHISVGSERLLPLIEHVAYIHVCVWIRIQIWICICMYLYLWFQGGKNKVYTPKLEILNTYWSHCCMILHSYPAQQHNPGHLGASGHWTGVISWSPSFASPLL